MEEALNLSFDRLLMMMMIYYTTCFTLFVSGIIRSFSVYVNHTPTHTDTDIFLLRCSVFACHLIGIVQNANFSNAFAQ